MIAGGTGITPMLQVVKAVIRGRAAGDKTEIDLIFANVTEQDILLREDLDTLAKEDPGFRVHYVLDRPPEGWTGGVGYVTSEMITVRVSLLILFYKTIRDLTNNDARNCFPSPPMMSKSFSAGPLPWSVVSRRLPRLLDTRRPGPSASLKTRSLLFKKISFRGIFLEYRV